MSSATIGTGSTTRPAGPDGQWLARLPEAVLAGVTPAYVYDLAEVRRNAAALRSALPAGSLTYYSLKANPHPVLQDCLRREGARAEVCSPGELDVALAAGFDPGQVLYTGPGKRDVDVDHALRRGVREFSVDSPVGIDQVSRLAAAAGAPVRLLLRVNDDQPARGQGLAMTGVPSQFGADTRWVLAEPHRFAGTPDARVIGLHLYMGTNLSAVGDLLAQFEQALRTAAGLREALAGHGVRLDTFDLGGGFGAPFARAGSRYDLDGLRPGLEVLLGEWVPGWRTGAVRVAFESGRYLTGTAGALLARVLDVKRSHGQEVVVLESGINHLGGMSGLRRLPPLAPQLVTVGPADVQVGTPVTKTVVAGPLCTPLDVWNRAADLPPLVPGQLLAVPNVGAYGLSASLVAFLGHPLPVEVVVDTDRADAVLDVSELRLVRVAANLQQTPSGRNH
ncbi:type III PLP-dependent enzyme [Dactylosporangium cerinum]|uniref:Type III PLP-dependent enzyme n=1 Tax=Dactylosporangium cerinum TaxID=1434730 RepID=A0ABV9W3R9_9ACTN